MNDVCLFYVRYAQQLQLCHLVLVYEKEVVFIPKSEKIGVAVLYETEPDIPQKEKSELEKGID